MNDGAAGWLMAFAVFALIAILFLSGVMVGAAYAAKKPVPCRNAINVTGTETIAVGVQSTAPVYYAQVWIDSQKLGPQLGTSPYSLSWTTSLSGKGCHVLQASAVDTNFTTGWSPMLTVNVQ